MAAILYQKVEVSGLEQQVVLLKQKYLQYFEEIAQVYPLKWNIEKDDTNYLKPNTTMGKMLLEAYRKYEIEKCEKKIISDEDGMGKELSYQRLNKLFNMTDQDLQSDFCFSVSERIAWQMSRGEAVDYKTIFNNIFIWDEEAS